MPNFIDKFLGQSQKSEDGLSFLQRAQRDNNQFNNYHQILRELLQKVRAQERARKKEEAQSDKALEVRVEYKLKNNEKPIDVENQFKAIFEDCGLDPIPQIKHQKEANMFYITLSSNQINSLEPYLTKLAMQSQNNQSR